MKSIVLITLLIFVGILKAESNTFEPIWIEGIPLPQKYQCSFQNSELWGQEPQYSNLLDVIDAISSNRHDDAVITLPILQQEQNNISAVDPFLMDFGGSGTEGGGQFVINDGVFSMRDRTESSNIICYKGSAVAAEISGWQQLIDNLKQYNWYLAQVYTQELEKLFICFGQGEMGTVVTDDPAAPFIINDSMQAQIAAIRINNTIIVNKNIFYDPKTTNQTRLELLFHEVTHSFLRVNDPLRNLHLRSFVDLVMDNQNGDLSADQFALNLRALGIQIYSDYRVLNQYKESLSVVIDKRQPLINRIVHAHQSKQISAALIPSHRELYASLLQTNELFQRFIEAKKYNEAMILHQLGAYPNICVDNTSLLRHLVNWNEKLLFTSLLSDKRAITDFGVECLQNPIDLPTLMEQAYSAGKKFHFQVLLEKQGISPKLLTTILGNDDQYFAKILVDSLYNNDFLNQVVDNKARNILHMLINNPIALQRSGFDFLMDRALPILATDISLKTRQAALLEVVDYNQNPELLFDYALSKNFLDVINKIIDQHQGNFINHQNKQGDRLITMAVIYGDTQLFHKLIQMPQLDLNFTRDGNNLLHLATIYNRIDMVQTIIKRDLFNIQQKNSVGMTAYDIAKRFQLKELMRYFKNLY